MKKMIAILLSVITLCMLTACKEETVDPTNTLSPAVLTPREQMLAGSQNIFIYDFETNENYSNVEVYVEVYKNGVKADNVGGFACVLPRLAEKKENERGSLAVILGADNRFNLSVSDQEGNVITSFASDAVQPIGEATYRNIVDKTGEYTPITGEAMTLAYLAFGDQEKTQGAFEEGVFLHPEDNEQAAVFDRIYLVKCRFYA